MEQIQGYASFLHYAWRYTHHRYSVLRKRVYRSSQVDTNSGRLRSKTLGISPSKFAQSKNTFFRSKLTFALIQHPISRFLARYIYNSPQQEYEKYLHYVTEEKERMMLRAVEASIKEKMAERRDYQAYYYKPVIGNYHRASKEEVDFMYKLRGASGPKDV